MSARQSAKTARHATAMDTTQAVDDWMATSEHPHKAMIQPLREAILAVDPAIAEGIKWNAPSFRTRECFATVGAPRGKSGLLLILHLGAKARTLPDGGLAIDDPDRLLTWLGKDRAQVSFADEAELCARTPALQAVLRQWIVLA